MKLLYFAWLRERIGRAEETIEVPGTIDTVSALVQWLRHRGEGYEAAFSDLRPVRVAVNQEYVDMTAPVNAGDEVAFFPPVTGGCA